MIDAFDIDRLAEAHYAAHDPQFETDEMRCAGCGFTYDFEEMFEYHGEYFCKDCYEDLELEEEEEEDG